MNYKEALFFIGKCLTISHEEHNRILVEDELKSGTVDWDSIVKVSTAHFVFSALYCNLKEVEFLHYLPSDLVEYMKHITDLNRERNLQIIEQAKEINDLLLSNKITPIFLKGTGNLLEGLYNDVAERMVGDIDFLVSKDDFSKTVELFKQNQYKKTSDRLTSPFYVKHYPRIFNKNKISAVEIHIEMIEGEKSSFFNYQKIYDSLITKKSLNFLSYLDQLTLTILANQHNDNGGIFKTFSLRNSYDTYLISQKIEKKPIINKAFFKTLNNYLYVSAYFLNSKKIFFNDTISSKIHLKILTFKLDYPLFGKLHTNFWKLLIFVHRKLLGTIRFITKKEFRKYYLKKLGF